MKRKSNPYKYILLLVSILFCGLIYAITITDISNYPDGMTTSNSSVLFNYNVSFAENDNMTNLNWSWDGTNYSIFDSSLVLFMNFDNRSSLNENDSRVQDLSLYNNSGTVVGGSNISWTPNGKYGGAFNFSGGVNYINLSLINIDLLSRSIWYNNLSGWNHVVEVINKTNIFGEEWTRFRGDNGIGNSTRNSTGLYYFDNYEITVFPDAIRGSVIISDGMLYFGSFNNRFYRVNATNMTQTHFIQRANFDAPSTIFEEYIYVGNQDDKIYQLNKTNLIHINNYTTNGDVDVAPLISNGYVYVGSDDNSIYQLNASNLSYVNNYTTGDMIKSSAFYSNGYVYVGSDDNSIYQLNASNLSYVNNYTTSGNVYSSPLIVGDYVYVGSDDNSIYQLNASNLSYVNNYTTSGSVRSSPVYSNGYVYVGSDDNSIYQLNATDMSLVNRYVTAGDISSTPAVVDGYVYVGSDDNSIYQLNATDMSLVNRYKTGGQCVTSPAVANSYVYIGCDDKRVYKFTKGNSYLNSISSINYNFPIFINSKTINIGEYRSIGEFFNGSIDNIMVFNRSLSFSEVQQLYYSSLTKYNSQNWSFQTNQTFNYSTSFLVNASNPSYNFNYNLCSSNLTTEVCSSTQTITQTIPNKVLTANFTTVHKTLNSNGVIGVSGSGEFSSTPYKIDTDDNGNRETNANFMWHRENFVNMKGGWFRGASLELTSSNYANTSDPSGVNFTGDFTNTTNLVEWAYKNNININSPINKIPSWLVDNSSGNCNGDTSNEANCTPTNYTKYANIIEDAHSRITNNYEYNNVYHEINNEPQFSWGMANWTTHFNNVYNYTKVADSRIRIGGGACLTFSTYVNFCLYTLANMTNRDFYSFHHAPLSSGYLGTGITNNLKEAFDWLLGNCSGNCSTFLMSEGYINNAMITTNDSLMRINLANAYIDLLNYNSSVEVFYSGYVWQSQYGFSYYNNPTRHLGYPTRWDWVSEVGLDNKTSPTYYPPYNVTKNFATLCPAGSTVYTSSSDDSTIKTVTCKKGNQRSLIVINTDTVSKNVTVNTTSSGITTLTDYLNHSRTFTASGNTNLGIMDSYDILYLTEDLQSPSITIQSPTSSTYSTTTIYFNLTLDEEGDTCIYSLNNFITNYSMTKQGWVNEFKASNSTMSQGYQIVNFSCNDTSNNWNNTASVNFTIDTTNPSGAWYNITNNSYFNYDKNYSINASDNLGISNISLYINGVLNETKTYLTGVTNTILGYVKTLSDGVYTMYWEIRDWANNLFTSDTYTVTIDTTAPSVDLVSPTTNAGNYSVSNLYINITSSDLSNYSLISNIGLKLWLRLNNETGENESYVIDYSGNSNNGIGFNTTVNNSGVLGKSLNFNGNAWINISNSNSLNISNSITISSWVKIDKYLAYRRIVAKSHTSGSAPYTMYGLLTDSNATTGTYFNDGKRAIRMELASNGTQYLIRSTTSLNENQWYLVTGTFDGSTGQAKIYINGVLDNSTLYKTLTYSPVNLSVVTNLTLGKIDTNNNVLSIGASGFGGKGSDFHNGSIDDVLIYNRALNPEEISAMYLSNSHSIDKNLTNILDGTYNLTAYAQDIFGYVNQSSSRLITLDTTNPIVSLISPEHGTQDTDGSVRFIYSVSETNNLINCSLKYADNLTYTTTSSSKGTNVLEVNIESGHQLYSENLKWFVSCTDNFNNVGYSSIFSLDTIPSLSGGTGGTTGTFTSNASSELNPKYVNFNYPEIWTRNSKTKVIIQSYNQSNNIFYPNKVTFEHSINGLSLEETGKTNLNEYFAVFKVSNSAELGNQTIKVTIEDQRKITYELNFEIDDGITITTIDGENKIIDETSRYILYILSGLLFLAFMVILIISLVSDSKRR